MNLLAHAIYILSVAAIASTATLLATAGASAAGSPVVRTATADSYQTSAASGNPADSLETLAFESALSLAHCVQPCTVETASAGRTDTAMESVPFIFAGLLGSQRRSERAA